MKIFQSLTAKLLAVTIAILTLAVIFITILNIINFSISYRQSLNDRSITVAENIRSVVNKNLKYFPLDGFTGMDSLLQDVLVNNPGLAYCYIANANRVILYHSKPDFTSAASQTPAPGYSFRDKNARGETVSSNIYYESIIPVIYENDYVGTVHVGIEKKIIEHKILTMVIQNALVLILFLAAAIFLLYQLITRHVTRPVSALVNQAINIAKNQNTSDPIPVTSDDEVGKLALTFNEMQASLNSYIKELNFRNNALQTINILADKLYRTFDMQTIARDAVDSLASYSNSPYAAIYEVDEGNNILRCLYHRGFSAHLLETTAILPIKNSFSGTTVRNRQIVTTFDVATDETILPEIRQILTRDGINTCISIPLLFHDDVLGIINLFFYDQNRRQIEDYERDALTSLGKTISLAMSNARHVAQIQAQMDERQKAEEEIRRLNEELEKRVTERTKELEFANKELESFSYSISHDLRTPLRSLDGFSLILLEDHAAELSPDASRYLRLLRANTQQMGKLITDILSFSRMSRQPLTREITDPAELAKQALNDLQSMQKNRRVEIIISDMPLCHADPALLKIVYVNLLSNALKFTSKKEMAAIEIGCMKTDNDIYFVRDNGVGFDMKYIGKVFGVFQRLHRSDEFEGTGCGTAIIQRIVNRHGGRVWAEAELNKGATFYFTLGAGGKEHEQGTGSGNFIGGR